MTKVLIDGMDVSHSTGQTYPFQTENISVASGATPHVCGVYDKEHSILCCSSRKIGNNM